MISGCSKLLLTILKLLSKKFPWNIAYIFRILCKFLERFFYDTGINCFDAFWTTPYFGVFICNLLRNSIFNDFSNIYHHWTEIDVYWSHKIQYTSKTFRPMTIKLLQEVLKSCSRRNEKAVRSVFGLFRMITRGGTIFALPPSMAG